MDKTLLPLSILLLASCACTPAPEEEEPPAELAEEEPGNLIGPPVTGDCGAEGYQGFVGSPLAAVTYPSDLKPRIIEPGQAYTMEYDPERMNIQVDEEGTITRVYCG
ncbi:I78 family peptidase inhibitor [Parvularcula maris]|uniref:I78 family peptidase inhibitor n=1 Tax=Parvularcula maris TaxID=2965077 RepID=A0A9X2LBG5_9PROT|nr:I78 family peptidase inhibitor [Parvularcula maris]MCQ8186612.1 I78 family peptidase inhibitor [Parvularcula maris]